MQCRNLSASSISCFLQCPLKYYASVELKLKEEYKHPSAIVGQAVHKVLEKLVKDKVLPDVKLICESYEIVKSEKLVKDLVKNAINLGYLKNISYLVDVEYSFKLPFGEGTNLVGFIDRLDKKDDEIIIHDIKTNYKKYTKEELKENYQAKVYNIAMRKVFPDVKKVDVLFWFVKCKDRQLCSFSEEQTAIDEVKVKDIREKIINTHKPKPIKNKYCDWCVYYKHCPLFNENEFAGLSTSL